MNKTIHVFVSGKVQGVWYRDSTVNEANKIGVAGWVRNMRDGRVELVVQGDETQIEKLIEWCWQGPELAEVSDIESNEVTDSEIMSGFIRRPTA